MSKGFADPQARQKAMATMQKDRMKAYEAVLDESDKARRDQIVEKFRQENAGESQGDPKMTVIESPARTGKPLQLNRAQVSAKSTRQAPSKTREEAARAARPDLPWKAADAAEARERQHRASLGAAPKVSGRRSIVDPAPARPKDNRTEDQKRMDKALVKNKQEWIDNHETGITSKEAMYRAVEVAYGANKNLEPKYIKAIAVLCWELELSPNPALAHMYGFEHKGRFIVMLGIWGMVALARRHHDFILVDDRDMTPEERQQNGLNPNDIGIMGGIIDMREMNTLCEALGKTGVKMGIDDVPKLMAQLTHWQPGIWRDGDSIPNTWTARMVAIKRSMRMRLKMLGLNSKIGLLPEVEGMNYDADEMGWVSEQYGEVESGGDTPAESTPAEAIEAIFEDQLAQEQTRESAASASVPDEPVQSTPDETPDPQPVPDDAPDLDSESSEATSIMPDPDPQPSPSHRTIDEIIDVLKSAVVLENAQDKSKLTKDQQAQLRNHLTDPGRLTIEEARSLLWLVWTAPAAANLQYGHLRAVQKVIPELNAGEMAVLKARLDRVEMPAETESK